METRQHDPYLQGQEAETCRDLQTHLRPHTSNTVIQGLLEWEIFSVCLILE